MKIRAFNPSRMRPWRCLPALVALVLVSPGCGEDTTPRIGLTLTATPEVGGPGSPITIRALVENSGGIPVTHTVSCTTGFATVIQVMDPDGQVVTLDCPAAAPACPPFVTDLKPGRSVDSSLVFAGLICGPDEKYEAAPAGLYTVRSTFSFSYSRDGHDEGDAIEDVTTFRWE